MTWKNGVLRIIEVRPASDGGIEKHVFELTPLTPEEFALRSRS